LLGLIFLALHRTLGGYQFGSRYTLDLLPLALLFLLDARQRELQGEKEGLAAEPVPPLAVFLMGFGCLLNLYGALAMPLLHS
jgi:hypothetical protein